MIVETKLHNLFFTAWVWGTQWNSCSLPALDLAALSELHLYQSINFTYTRLVPLVRLTWKCIFYFFAKYKADWVSWHADCCVFVFFWTTSEFVFWPRCSRFFVVHCLTMKSQCLVLISGCCFAGIASAQVEREQKNKRHRLILWHPGSILNIYLLLWDSQRCDLSKSLLVCLCVSNTIDRSPNIPDAHPSAVNWAVDM